MKRHSGKVRIIGGHQGSRVISFKATTGLRPTPDRVRETLFNWLMPYTEGSLCLDLFAGTGALGIEALSRGANKTIFVETNKQAMSALKQNLAQLELSNHQLINQSALAYLSQANDQFDIVFIDPPYQSDLLEKSIDILSKQNLIKPNGWIYIESSSNCENVNTPAHWQLKRSTQAGEVNALLYQIES